jgi:hypothetical protein
MFTLIKIPFIAFVMLTAGECTSSQQDQTSNEFKIDSTLSTHFTFLEKAFETRTHLTEDMIQQMSDSLAEAFQLEVDVIEFFERVTHIHAIEVHNFAFGKTYDQKTLQRWKKWVKQNRHLLFWDAARRNVNRRDEDIYSGR